MHSPAQECSPTPAMRAKAFAQAMWLLTRLGNYVLYRLPPESGTSWVPIQQGGIFLTGLFLLPLLLRKRYALATVLIYSVIIHLFARASSAVRLSCSRPLSFSAIRRSLHSHCLALVQRNRTFAKMECPRLGRCSLLWLVSSGSRKPFSIWLNGGDPRSVWFAAARKSADFHPYLELGWEYLQKAGSFGTKRRNPPLPTEEAKQYASVVWENDSRLPQLLAELSDNQRNRPVENGFKEYLQTKALESFDEALTRRGTNITPDLFLCRGYFSPTKVTCSLQKGIPGGASDEGSQLHLLTCGRKQ